MACYQVHGQDEKNINKDEIRSPKAFRSKSRGGSFCCVPGCHNQSGKDKANGVKRPYYRFPSEGSKQFRLWINAIRRDNFEYKSWHRVCSDHFKGGIKGHNESYPGYVPTEFSFKKQPTPRDSKNSSRTVVSPLKEANPSPSPKRKRPRKRTYKEYPLIKQPVVAPHPPGHDYVTTDVENCEGIEKYLPVIENKIKHLEEELAKNELYKSQVLDLNEMKGNPKQIQFWTGFSNYENFYSVFQFLEPRARNMQYWRRGSITAQTDHFSKSYENKPGPERKLSLLDGFFLTMVRLKVGLLTEDLAQRFNISTGTVSSIFTSWIILMYVNLKMVCELPSSTVTKENQSSAIGSLQVILDCTELFVQNPSKLDARKQLFSNYKHHNTYKFLIGISPQMGITYVSRMYGGRASDKFITSDSAHLLYNIETGKGSVMTDRGFLVEGILNDMGVKLHMPAFKGCDRPQLSAAEGASSEMISSVRIHIERAISENKNIPHIRRRTKTFNERYCRTSFYCLCIFA